MNRPHTLGIVGPRPHYSPSLMGYRANYDPQLSGFFSTAWSLVKKGVKVAAPIALQYVPGYGPQLSQIASGMISERELAKQASYAPPAGWVGPMTPQQQAGVAAQQELERIRQQQRAGSDPSNPASYPQWNGTGWDFAPLTQPPPTVGGRANGQQPAQLGLGGNTGMLVVLGGLALLLAMGRR